MLLALLAILAAVFVVATGRGGELAYEEVDHAPVDLGPVSPTDVALLRPPTALWGYNMQVADAALDQIARALRDRDIEIAYLRRQLADLGYSDYERPRDFVPKHALDQQLPFEEPEVPITAVTPVTGITAVTAAEEPPASPDIEDPVAADQDEPENPEAEEQGW